MIDKHPNMSFSDVVGHHPEAPDPFGTHIGCSDGETEQGVPYRLLGDGQALSVGFLAAMNKWLVAHHASPEKLDRERKRAEALSRLGFSPNTGQPGPFPTNCTVCP